MVYRLPTEAIHPTAKDVAHFWCLLFSHDVCRGVVYSSLGSRLMNTGELTSMLIEPAPPSLSIASSD